MVLESVTDFSPKYVSPCLLPGLSSVRLTLAVCRFFRYLADVVAQRLSLKMFSQLPVEDPSLGESKLGSSVPSSRTLNSRRDASTFIGPDFFSPLFQPHGSDAAYFDRRSLFVISTTPLKDSKENVSKVVRKLISAMRYANLRCFISCLLIDRYLADILSMKCSTRQDRMRRMSPSSGSSLISKSPSLKSTQIMSDPLSQYGSPLSTLSPSFSTPLCSRRRFLPAA